MSAFRLVILPGMCLSPIAVPFQHARWAWVRDELEPTGQGRAGRGSEMRRLSSSARAGSLDETSMVWAD